MTAFVTQKRHPLEGVVDELRLAPIGRETLQDRVYAQLRRTLIGGLFEPGEVLTIQNLASSLATSTMPVREALGRLISEKALEALPNRSVRVPLMTPGRLDDLLRARVLIEGEAIGLATPRLTDADLDRLASLLAEWEAIRRAKRRLDLTQELELNQAFHFLIYRAAGSAVLIPMIESLWLQSGPCVRAAARAYAETETGDVDTAQFHRRMVEALAARDAAEARAALVADIARPFRLLRERAATQPEG